MRRLQLISEFKEKGSVALRKRGGGTDDDKKRLIKKFSLVREIGGRREGEITKEKDQTNKTLRTFFISLLDTL